MIEEMNETIDKLARLLSDTSIRLTTDEREMSQALLLHAYPGSYRKMQDELYTVVATRMGQAPLTDVELVKEIERALYDHSSVISDLRRIVDRASMPRRECEFCGELFRPHRKDQRFCPGGKCGNAYHSQRRRERS